MLRSRANDEKDATSKTSNASPKPSQIPKWKQIVSATSSAEGVSLVQIQSEPLSPQTHEMYIKDIEENDGSLKILNRIEERCSKTFFPTFERNYDTIEFLVFTLQSNIATLEMQ